jgi:hypothetical protein
MQYVYSTIFTPSPKSGSQSCSRTNPKRPLDRSAGDSLSDNRYQLVDEILAATSYYSVLGISRKTSPEDVRRAYIKVAFCAHFFVMAIRRFVIFLTHPHHRPDFFFKKNRGVEFAILTNLFRLMIRQQRLSNVKCSCTLSTNSICIPCVHQHPSCRAVHSLRNFKRHQC